MKRKRLD